MDILFSKLAKNKLFKGLRRVTLLGSMVVVVSAIATSLSTLVTNHQPLILKSQKNDSELVLSRSSPNQAQKTYNLWLFTGGVTAGIVIEALLSKKRLVSRQTKQELQQLQAKAQQLKQHLEEQIREIPLLIAQKGQTRADLECYYQRQVQQSQELESAIADYETQLYLRLKEQQTTLETLERLQQELEGLQSQKNASQEIIAHSEQNLEKLQWQILVQEQEKVDKLQILLLLRQQLEETRHNEQEVRQRLHKLNQKISRLTCDRNEARAKLEHLEQQFAGVSDINGLIFTLESARYELERVKEQAKQFEQYVIAENEHLATKNQQLQRKLGSANAKIQYLQYTLAQNKITIKSSNLEDNRDLERYLLIFSHQVSDKLYHLAETDAKKYRKICKTLDSMSFNLRHHSLQTHEYAQISGPKGEKVFESYVEHRTPNAWRIFWYYGPGQKCLTIHDISPHP